MGRIDRGVKCSVIGCDMNAVRSIPADKVAAAGLKVNEARHLYLCRDHYKEFKKATKRSRMLDRWRYRSQLT